MKLEELKIKLKKMIAEDGIAATISALKEVLPEQSERFEDILLVESRQNEANRQRLRNLISNEDLQITYARIREDLMNLVDELQDEDFDQAVVDEDKVKGKKVKRGSILHRIPDQMQLDEETKCIVRIALDEEVIIRNIDLDEEVVLKPIRISDIMQVELIDPSDEHPFKINAISSAEQFVEEDDYTEWVFFVTPLLEGVFPLLLKVAVIELMHGKERKREIVLEESIQIVAEAAGKPSGSFKDAGYKLTFGEAVPSPEKPDLLLDTSKGTQAPNRGKDLQEDLSDFVDISGAAEKSSEGSAQEESSGRKPTLVLLKRMSMTLIVLAVFTGAAYAIVPSEVSWLSVRYLTDNKQAYNSYIQKYEGSRHLEEAYFRRAKLDPQLGTLRDYVEKYPTGKYLPTVRSEIKEIEKERFEALQLDPSRTRLENYLETFPDGTYTEEVRKQISTIDRISSIRELTLDQEEKLWQQILKENKEEDLKNYIESYPEGRYLQEAKKRLANLQAIKEINLLKDASRKDLEGILKRFPESDAEPLIKTRMEKLRKKKG